DSLEDYVRYLHNSRTAQLRHWFPGAGVNSRAFRRSTNPITSDSVARILSAVISTGRFTARVRSNTLASTMSKPSRRPALVYVRNWRSYGVGSSSSDTL